MWLRREETHREALLVILKSAFGGTQRNQSWRWMTQPMGYDSSRKQSLKKLRSPDVAVKSGEAVGVGLHT